MIRKSSLAEPIEEIDSPSLAESTERPDLRLLRDQLSLYRQELVRADDPAHKMNLRRLIHELQNKISDQLK